jgi:glycosyltransferase involved in cell wall biosynthesis
MPGPGDPLDPSDAGWPLGERRPVCVIVHAYYEEDARVRRQAEALVARGRPVDVYALRRPDDGPSDSIEGVSLRRLPVSRHQGAGLATYLLEYLAFLAFAAWAAWRAQGRRRYALAQVHTLPDFLVVAALPLKLAGVPVVLDLHEAMPEFFRSRFPHVANRLFYGLLALQERLAIRMADAVITVNHALSDRLLRRGVPAAKVTVVLNAPAPARFDRDAHPERPFMADGVLRLVYAGALTPIYELDVLLLALVELARRRPELRVELDLYGRGDMSEALEAQVASLGLSDRVRLHGRIPLEAVAAAVAAADIGVAPTRRDAFTDVSLSTKIFEYAVMGKPVVASRLPTVERYFPPDTLATYTPGDPVDLAAVIGGLVDDPGQRAERSARTDARLRRLAWYREVERYVALVERLALDGRAKDAPLPVPDTPGAVESAAVGLREARKS